MSDAQSDCCQGSCATEVSDDFVQLVPQDKRLSDDWIRSLYERGEPEIYSGHDLEYIGMPIGGICAGQVYLGGDGQLWHWDVFKAYGGGYDGPIDPRGYHYPRPLKQKSPLEQGFAVKITNKAGESIRPLNENGFTDIQFDGRYPLATVGYSDVSFPATVELTAYSPFIPLDEQNSALPVTILEYTVANPTDETVDVEIGGWLENLICRYDDEPGNGKRHNETLIEDGSATLNCRAIPDGDSDPSQFEAFGSMSLRVLAGDFTPTVAAQVPSGRPIDVSFADRVFGGLASKEASAELPFGTQTVGAVGAKFSLAPDETRTVKFAISWYFPRYTGGTVFFFSMEDIPNLEQLKRHYASKFDSSIAVLDYVSANYEFLSTKTKSWTRTWNDTSLPHWLMNRVGANTSTLATQTCHWFDNGRFYGWEGVDCCPGTCQHVWQYAQTISRLFPELERRLREDIDYGIAYCEDGSISYRGEAGITGVDMKQESEGMAFFATDGQLGTILRVYREHTMSADNAFLKRLWPRVKKSIQFMMTKDHNGDGLLDGSQFHTLDTNWHGEIPWISSLYLAGLAAGKTMANEVGDDQFAQECEKWLEIGKSNFVERLFNGEYFVHRPDPEHPKSMDLAEGSYIDQVFGQSYSLQLGLERVIPIAETISALNSLWKYNFTPDVGPYRDGFKEVEGGRWYAMPGEGGLLMCTWPRGDCNRSQHEQTLLGLDVTSEGYLNECMSGFEYQVASHMVGEGLLQEGLAVARSVHDRYHPAKRNPWNEIECSDHYSRAMASYGVFLNVCGFHYHGPQGMISFKPKLNPTAFRAPFTTAKSWGTFSQTAANGKQDVALEICHGELVIQHISLENVLGRDSTKVRAKLAGEDLPANLEPCPSGGVRVSFAAKLQLLEGQELKLEIA